MAIKEIPFYNVDQAVGQNAPNRRTDVLLVQFFLRELFNHPVLKPVKPAGEIVVNGICDDTTKAWILDFQRQHKQRGFRIQTDGRVDHATGQQWSRTPRTGSHYTIGLLNFRYRQRFRREHDALELHPRMPAELAAELKTGEPKALD